MPTSGKRWRHIMFNTYCSWLPGDERGFRNHYHRIHSSGDYKHPPPSEEHEGLRRYNEDQKEKQVILPRALRARVGNSIVENLIENGHSTLVVSVSSTHAHVLVELPDDLRAIRRIIGWCKQKSSKAVFDSISGRLWSARGRYDPIDDASHLKNTYNYIFTKQGPGAWTWSYRTAHPDPGAQHRA